MTNLRTKYTEEYRRETADYTISTGRPVAAVAAELGLPSENRFTLGYGTKESIERRRAKS